MLLAYVGRAGRLRGPSYRKPTPVSVPSPQGEALKPYSILELAKRYVACLVVSQGATVVVGAGYWLVMGHMNPTGVASILGTWALTHVGSGVYLTRRVSARIRWWSPVADLKTIAREKRRMIRLWPFMVPWVIWQQLWSRI